MSDEYASVSKSKLKLKNDAGIKKKKKKSKDKDREIVQQTLSNERSQSASKSGERALTKAEIAFKQQQEKMRNKRILEKASTTHKERVEKFNEHLDTLTEHFDIPKVSWTK
ncbi:protein FAM32A [Stomoxys calcitrans]|uniref:FAM32A-like n=1 Tax=Stomoxys calcitrans TaxID=35570 RepID=A0A1I8NMM8_STOCA|nr:protein FAM32A [Stomoxys calcitrans]